jgi:hypothetical protein
MAFTGNEIKALLDEQKERKGSDGETSAAHLMHDARLHACMGEEMLFT